VAPPPSLNPADTLRRRGDLATTDRQSISLAPTAQCGTSGDDPGYRRQVRQLIQKIRPGAMPPGRSRSPSSGIYPTPSWRAAAGIHSPKSLPCLRHGSGNSPRRGMPRKKEERQKFKFIADLNENVL